VELEVAEEARPATAGSGIFSSDPNDIYAALYSISFERNNDVIQQGILRGSVPLAPQQQRWRPPPATNTFHNEYSFASTQSPKTMNMAKRLGASSKSRSALPACTARFGNPKSCARRFEPIYHSPLNSASPPSQRRRRARAEMGSPVAGSGAVSPTPMSPASPAKIPVATGVTPHDLPPIHESRSSFISAAALKAADAELHRMDDELSEGLWGAPTIDTKVEGGGENSRETIRNCAVSTESPSRTTPLSPSLVVKLPGVIFEAPKVAGVTGVGSRSKHADGIGSPHTLGSSRKKRHEGLEQVFSPTKSSSSPTPLRAYDMSGMILPKLASDKPKMPGAQMQKRALHSHTIHQADLEWLVASPQQKHNRRTRRRRRQ
jgi:hypothetical protein